MVVPGSSAHLASWRRKSDVSHQTPGGQKKEMSGMLPSLPENNQWHRARQPKYRGVTLYWDVADTDSGAGDQKKAIKRGSPILTGAHDSETTEKAHDAFPSLPRFFLFDQLDRIADQIRRQRALAVVSLLLHHGRLAPPDSM